MVIFVKFLRDLDINWDLCENFARFFARFLRDFDINLAFCEIFARTKDRLKNFCENKSAIFDRNAPTLIFGERAESGDFYVTTPP